MKNTHRQLRNAALKKIRTQIPDTPEARLCFAIIEKAVDDLTDEEHKRAAEKYLTQESIFHAEICGVETSWIQRIFCECEILNRPRMAANTGEKK